jgi:hypothetical protein
VPQPMVWCTAILHRAKCPACRAASKRSVKHQKLSMTTDLSPRQGGFFVRGALSQLCHTRHVIVYFRRPASLPTQPAFGAFIDRLDNKSLKFRALPDPHVALALSRASWLWSHDWPVTNFFLTDSKIRPNQILCGVSAR